MHEQGLSAAAAFMRLTDHPLGADDRILVDSVLAVVMVGGMFTPPTGTLEALWGSGRLELLDDPELAAELTGWTADVASQGRQDIYVGDGIVALFQILGARSVDVGLLFGADGRDFPFDEDALATPWPAATTEAYRHVHFPDVRNQVSLMWFIHRSSLRNLGRRRLGRLPTSPAASSLPVANRRHMP